MAFCDKMLKCKIKVHKSEEVLREKNKKQNKKKSNLPILTYLSILLG